MIGVQYNIRDFGAGSHHVARGRRLRIKVKPCKATRIFNFHQLFFTNLMGSGKKMRKKR